MRALNQAYTSGQRPTAFPIENLVRMLMFRNTAEASDFVQNYGLAINEKLVNSPVLTHIKSEEPCCFSLLYFDFIMTLVCMIYFEK